MYKNIEYRHVRNINQCKVGRNSQILSSSHTLHRGNNLVVGKRPIYYRHVTSEQEVGWFSGRIVINPIDTCTMYINLVIYRKSTRQTNNKKMGGAHLHFYISLPDVMTLPRLYILTTLYAHEQETVSC